MTKITQNITLHEEIKNQIMEAMRAHDQNKLDALRGIVAMFSYELIAKKSSDIYIDDESAVKLISKSVKQHRDSIEQFEKGGRKDLVKKEKAELVILEKYLPEMMSVDDIKKVVKKKLSEAGTIDSKKIGQFLGGIMKELKGKADGGDVKKVVDEMIK